MNDEALDDQWSNLPKLMGLLAFLVISFGTAKVTEVSSGLPDNIGDAATIGNFFMATLPLSLGATIFFFCVLSGLVSESRSVLAVGALSLFIGAVIGVEAGFPDAWISGVGIQPRGSPPVFLTMVIGRYTFGYAEIFGWMSTIFGFATGYITSVVVLNRWQRYLS